MNAQTCSAPTPFTNLVEYWFGELAQDEEERIEEHLLGCTRCSGQLGNLAALGAGIRSAFRGGRSSAVVSPGFLVEMKQHGLRLREYRVPPGGSVNCTITAADDAVVGRLQAALTDASRVDLVLLHEPGAGRLPDIPFDPAKGEVLFCPSAAGLKQMPAHTQVIRLLAVDATGERPLADYTFVHTPS